MLRATTSPPLEHFPKASRGLQWPIASGIGKGIGRQEGFRNPAVTTIKVGVVLSMPPRADRRVAAMAAPDSPWGNVREAVRWLLAASRLTFAFVTVLPYELVPPGRTFPRAVRERDPVGLKYYDSRRAPCPPASRRLSSIGRRSRNPATSRMCIQVSSTLSRR